MFKRLLGVVSIKVSLQVLSVILCIAIGIGSTYAQYSGDRTFEKPLEGGASSSFRERDFKERLNTRGQSGQGSLELLQKGNMMTQTSMSGLMYQVHVLGEVGNPGTYRVMASERLAEVLNRADGVAEQGSQRKIEIRRDGKVVKVVDLLSFKLYGRLDHNPYLLDNDVIFVPLKDRSVQVVGSVKRPSIYELVGEESASKVIQLAGGVAAGVAKNEPVRVIRFVDGKKEVIDLDQVGSEMSDFRLKDGDVVVIPDVITAGHKFDYNLAKLPGGNTFYPSNEDRVFVLGGVGSPGAYPFNPYYSVYQYITVAGGFSELSTKKIKILTPEGKKHKIKINDVQKAQVNPGDTIYVGYRRIAPETWAGLLMGFTGFGLSTTATVLSLTNR